MYYGTTTDADDYHSARGNTDWASKSTEEKEIALQRASDWVDNTYRNRFPGWKVGRRSQEREWPRYNAFDAEDELIPSDVIPVEILNATYEAALREAVTPGTLAPDQERTLKRIKADTVELEYAGGSSQLTTFTVIDGILAGILSAGGGLLFGQVTR